MYSPDSDSPAGQVADREWSAAYDDLDTVGEFARSVDVVTLEFENIPTATVEEISDCGAGAARYEGATYGAEPATGEDFSP